jgi:cysteine desulfuration protein SufE
MTAPLPPTIARTLERFRAMDRETRMQALLVQAKKLEPLPERLAALDRAAFTVPECQTRVDLFPEVKADGTLHVWADVNVRQSPTIAAVLAITFSAVNDQPPEVALALPPDFVRQLMDSIGLGTREAGLSAMVRRIQRHAAEAVAARDATVAVAPARNVARTS